MGLSRFTDSCHPVEKGFPEFFRRVVRYGPEHGVEGGIPEDGNPPVVRQDRGHGGLLEGLSEQDFRMGFRHGILL